MTRQGAVNLFKAISYIGIYGGLLMPLVFIPIVIFPFVFSKLIALQILIGLTFPAYLALAWMEPRYRPAKSVLYTAIIAYFGALTLSTIFSVDPLRSWWGNQERMNGLYTMLHLFAWLTMTIGVLKTWDQWKKILGYEVVLSVIMAIVALLQKPFPKLLLFEAQDRVGGLLDNPIYMGAYQIFNLSFIVLLFLKTKSRTARILLGIAALFDIGAFFAAESRGALLGLGAAVAVFALTYAILTPNRKAKAIVLGAAGAAAILYGAVFMLRTTPFVANNSILNRLTNFSVATETRYIAWNIAWKGFLERPLTGWGFDAFHILFNAKYNPKSLEFGYYETWFDRAHNTVMDVLSMTGIFGFITFFGIFAAIFYLVWRAHRRGWIDITLTAVLTALPIGYFLQNLFVFDHPAAFSMSYFMFALVIASTRPGFLVPAEVSETASGTSRGTPWTMFTIVQIIGVFFAWRFSALPFQASVLSIRANNALNAGQVDVAFDLFKKAGSIPTPYLDEQSFLISRDIVELADGGVLTRVPKWEELYAYAKDISEKTNKEHPLNTNNVFVYARLLHSVFPYLPKDQQGAEIAHAEQLYLQSLESSPKRQQIAYGLARLYTQIGQGQKAYDVLKEALDNNPNIGEGRWYLGLVEFSIGKTEEGAADLVKAVQAKSPFQFRGPSDAMQLAQAAVLQKNVDALKHALEAYPTISPLQVGSPQAIYDLFKEASGKNPDSGEDLWYLGVAEAQGLAKVNEGSADLVKAMKAKEPFKLRGAPDALVLARAALTQKDTDTLRSVFKMLPTLPPDASTDNYLNIAKAMESGGLIAERNGILNALVQIDSTLTPKLEGLRSGKAQTIDESIRMASSSVAVAPSSTAPTPVPASTPTPAKVGPRK